MENVTCYLALDPVKLVQEILVLMGPYFINYMKIKAVYAAAFEQNLLEAAKGLKMTCESKPPARASGKL